MKNNKFSLTNFKGLQTSEMVTINGGVNPVNVDKYSTSPYYDGGDTDCKDVIHGAGDAPGTGIIKVYQ